MKKATLKTLLLLLVMLTAGASSAWSYNRTLTEDLEVSGYKLKAFYDFQNNSPEVLPTSGDLRYRDGGTWGLHNFGSGTRSATASIPVAEGDILVLQHYSGIYATINRGTLNNQLSSSTNFQVYDITTDANDVTFTIARYGGIIAALVMEVDASVEMTNFTVNYVFGDETVKSISGSSAVGSTINADDVVWNEAGTQKYFVADGATTSIVLTANESENVLSVNLRKAESYTYTLTTSYDGNALGFNISGNGFEGETVYLKYPAYQVYNETVLVQGPRVGSRNQDLQTSVTLTENTTIDIAYTATGIEDIYMLAEAEDLGTGLSTSSTTYNSRISGSIIYGASGTLMTLPAGKYIFTLGTIGGDADKHQVKYNVYAGETPIIVDKICNGNTLQLQTSEEFVLASETAITFTSSDPSSDRGIDLVYVQKTGDVEVVSYTIKYVDTEGKELKESVSRTGIPNTAIELTEADKEAIWITETFEQEDGEPYTVETKYVYDSDDAEGKTAAEGTVVTITFREAVLVDFKVVAVDTEGNAIKTFIESNVLEGETKPFAFSKYIQDAEGSWYEVAAPYAIDAKEGENKVVCTAATADFDYFYEAEGLKTTHSAASFSESTSLSNSYGFGMAANHALYTKEAVPAGVYTIYASGLSRRSGSTNIKLNLRDAAGNEIETGKTLTWANADKEAVEMTAEGVEVPEGFSLSLHEATGYNSVTYLDYITLKKTADFSGKVEYYGDANGDGSVDISDVVAVVNYILNGGATGTFASENADVNADGTVDISDVVGVVNMILNGEMKPRAVVAE